MEILAYNKETEGKYRWEGDVDGVSFKLYLKKWRVPKDIPGRIRVRILSEEPSPAPTPLSKEAAATNPDLLRQPVFAELAFEADHTETVRFDPVGGQDATGVGSCYVPKTVPGVEDADSLFIRVDWA